MDAIEMLEEQHRDVADLFDEVEAAEVADKQDLFYELADELTVHAAIEERYFYPAARDRRTEDRLRMSVEEHLTMKRLLADLLQLDPRNEAFAPKLAVLKHEVARHVQEEEQELFPLVRKTLDRKQLVAIAEEMIVMQESLLDAGDPRERLRAEMAAAAPLG
jgi:iron-sulfur cluster repair protein YtfE (RIC family)